MEQDYPELENIIDLNNDENRLDSSVNRITNYNISIDRDVLSENFLCNSDKNIIVLYDLLFGTQKYIFQSNFQATIWTYIGLSINRGFIFYGTLTSKYVSIISINFDDETYELIGVPYELPFVHLVLPDWINYLPNYGIAIRCAYRRENEWPLSTRLHLFKLDSSLSNIEFHRSLSIPTTGYFFHMIDEKIVFANPNRRAQHRWVTVENFMKVNDDYSLSEFENTRVCLKSYFVFKDNRTKTGMWQSNGCWRESQFFFLYNLKYSHNNLLNIYSRPSIPNLSVFDMKTKKWSEIHFNYPVDIYHFLFYVNGADVLNVACYGKCVDKPGESLTQSINLIRIPLRKPDKLTDLCYFRVRKCDFL